MAISLFQHGAIRTTEAKAKELKPFVEKLITTARKGTLHARRLVSAELGNRRGQRGVLYDSDENELDKTILQILFDDIAPRYASRPGGYTRIIRIAERRLGDGGKQVILQLVEETKAEAGGGSNSRRKQRAVNRHEAAAAAGTGETVAEAPADDEPTEAVEAEVAEAEAPEADAAADEKKA